MHGDGDLTTDDGVFTYSGIKTGGSSYTLGDLLSSRLGDLDQLSDLAADPDLLSAEPCLESLSIDEHFDFKPLSAKSGLGDTELLSGDAGPDDSSLPPAGTPWGDKHGQFLESSLGDLDLSLAMGDLERPFVFSLCFGDHDFAEALQLGEDDPTGDCFDSGDKDLLPSAMVDDCLDDLWLILC